VYAQVSCEQSTEVIEYKQKRMIAVAVFCFLISLVFTTGLSQMVTSIAIEKKNVELQIVNAGDYAV
jgi:hypothetical protein